MAKSKLITVTAQTLAALEAFAAQSAAVRSEIAALFQGRRYSRGDAIIRQRDPDCGVFFVISGSVRVTYFSKRGREVSFRDLSAGEMFGELSALDGHPRSAQVIAQSSACIAWLSREHFSKLLQHYPQFSEYVLQRLTRLVRMLSARVVDLSTLGVTNRIHAELLRLARAAEPLRNRAVIAPSPTCGEIASRISTHREAVNRELSAMEKQGLIQKDGRRAIVVLDVERLEAMVREVAA